MKSKILNMDNEYERMTLIRESTDWKKVVEIFYKGTYGFDFIEVFLDLELYRTGCTASTYESPRGFIVVEVKRKKDIKDIVQRLESFGFQDIDKEELENE